MSHGSLAPVPAEWTGARSYVQTGTTAAWLPPLMGDIACRKSAPARARKRHGSALWARQECTGGIVVSLSSEHERLWHVAVYTAADSVILGQGATLWLSCSVKGLMSGSHNIFRGKGMQFLIVPRGATWTIS